jgi:hypothetical protein
MPAFARMNKLSVKLYFNDSFKLFHCCYGGRESMKYNIELNFAIGISIIHLYGTGTFKMCLKTVAKMLAVC